MLFSPIVHRAFKWATIHHHEKRNETREYTKFKTCFVYCHSYSKYPLKAPFDSSGVILILILIWIVNYRFSQPYINHAKVFTKHCTTLPLNWSPFLRGHTYNGSPSKFTLSIIFTNCHCAMAAIASKEHLLELRIRCPTISFVISNLIRMRYFVEALEF